MAETHLIDIKIRKTKKLLLGGRGPNLKPSGRRVTVTSVLYHKSSAMAQASWNSADHSLFGKLLVVEILPF